MNADEFGEKVKAAFPQDAARILREFCGEGFSDSLMLFGGHYEIVWKILEQDGIDSLWEQLSDASDEAAQVGF